VLPRCNPFDFYEITRRKKERKKRKKVKALRGRGGVEYTMFLVRLVEKDRCESGF
jgi:hypothetical protein